VLLSLPITGAALAHPDRVFARGWLGQCGGYAGYRGCAPLGDTLLHAHSPVVRFRKRERRLRVGLTVPALGEEWGV
jgi:hypothetical protein